MSPHLRTVGKLNSLDKRLDRIERSLVEAHQRLARTILHGKVDSVRETGSDWQVRLDLGDGVLSPWLAVQPASAGALKIKVKPSVGEAMTMLSPSGTVGTGSRAVRGPFDMDHPAPVGAQDVIASVGETTIIVEDGRVLLSTGEATLELSGGHIRMRAEEITIEGAVALSGEGLTHNGANIGEGHRHSDVQNGTGLSGPPADGELS